MSMLSVATEYALHGWYVFPLQVGGKAPFAPAAPHGFKNATTDIEQVKAWWTRYPNANVGIATGASGLYVIDVDHKNGTKNGLAAWGSLEEMYGHTPTYTVSSATGGLHLYYQLPKGVVLKNTVGGPSGVKGLGADIDTRGEGGYIVAAGSKVDDGEYTVVTAMAPAPLPGWVVDVLTTPRTPVRSLLERSAPAPKTVKERARQLAEQLRNTPPGGRNAAVASISFMLGQYVGAGQLKRSKAISLLDVATIGWSNPEKTGNDIRRQLAEGEASPRLWTSADVDMTVFDGINLEQVDKDTPITIADAKGSKGATTATDWGTDTGQARRMLQILPDYIYVLNVGWFHWDGKVWEASSPEQVIGRLMGYYSAQHQRMVDKFAAQPDPVWSDRAAMFRMWMKHSRLVDLVKAMASQSLISVDRLDAHPDLLNTPTGVVDLRTGGVTSHDKSLFMTKITKGSYRPGYTHEDWESALTSLPKGPRAFLQLRLGQAATGHMAPTNDALILVGNGANGKSLMTTDGVFLALGDYARLAPAGLIMAGDNGDGPSPEKMALRGVRFALIEELPEGKALSIAELKRVTGTSSITARAMRQDHVTFSATHSLVVTTNYLPGVKETDDGTWRRLTPVNFPYRFVAPGQDVGEGDRVGDMGLPIRVRVGRNGQHDAIVTWLVEGAMLAYENPAWLRAETAPVEVREVAAGWRSKSDRIHAFLSASVERADGDGIAKKDLLAAFNEWLTEQGHERWGQELFYTRLLNHTTWRKLGAPREKQTTRVTELSRPDMGFGLPALAGKERVYPGLAFTN